MALVTGGGTGLGLAITQCLVEAGANVVITGRRQSVLDDAVNSLGQKVTAIANDVSRLETTPALIQHIEDRIGPIDILINNAGVHLKKTALETTDREFANVIETHVIAAFALSRETAKKMLPRKKGSIVFIASMAALMGIPDVSAYSAAKSAVLGLTRALSTEWSGQGIRVNTVVPGWIDAGMAREALERDPQRKFKILARTPLGRLGKPEDIGWAAVYLCSPAAQFITGSTLTVDGGAAVGF